MKEFLVFRLCAPLAAWGDTAVGEMRPSRNEPGESAIFGLLAAALGISRENETAHLALRDGYALTIAVLDDGKLLRDYHTAQVPGRAALKNHPHRTRRDELSVDKENINTILSTRDYRQDVQMLVAVQSLPSASHTLIELKSALERPKFVLYLGRKSCPLGAPVWPRIESAQHTQPACEQYLNTLADTVKFDRLKWWDKPAHPGLNENGKPKDILSLHWGEHSTVGITPTFSVPRKDHLLSRERWQFGDRTEYVALLVKES